MKNFFLKKLPYILIGLFLAMAGTVYAVQTSVPQATQLGDLATGKTSGIYQLLHPGADGRVLTASSTSANGLTWATAGAASAGGNPTDVQFNNGGALGGSDNFQYISGGNAILLNGTNSLIQASPTSTAIFGNTVLGGGVTNFSTSTNITAQNFLCGVGLAYISSTSSLTTNLKFPDLTQIGTQAAIGCGGGAQTLWSSQFSPQFVFNASTSSPLSVTASGTGETIFYAPGTGTVTTPRQGYLATGQFTASSTVSGATTTGMTMNFYFSGYQARATNPTIQGQFLMASSTASGGNPEWTIGNLLGTSPITITTSTAAQITVACATCLTGNQTITLTGDVTGSGATSIATIYNNVVGVTKGGTGTSTAPTQQGQVLLADGTGTKYGPATHVNTATFSWGTSTVAQLTGNVLTVPNALTFNNSGSGAASGQTFNGSAAATISYNTIGAQVSGTYLGNTNVSGTNGQVAYFTAANTVNSASKFLYDGTVIGVNATSSTISFNVQGTGTLDPFNIASSSGTSILQVKSNMRIGISSTTPTAMMVIEGTNAGANTSTPILIVATATNASLLTIQASGDILINGAATSTTAFLIKNPSAQTVLQVDENASFSGLTIGTTTTASLYAAAYLVVQGNSGSSTAPFILVASSSGTTILNLDAKGHFGIGGTAPTLTSCNTGTVLPNSTDVSGAVIPGAAQTTCTITFATARTNTPFCVVTQAVGSAVTGLEGSSTPTTLVITGTTIGGDTITYWCPGN